MARRDDPLTVFIALAMRNGTNCYLCGQPLDPADPMQIEHRKPRAAGGTDDLDNLALAHASCNQAKGTRSVVSA